MIQLINFIDRCRFSCLSLFLGLIIFFAYFPSLGHVFRADQLIYMADMGRRPQTIQSLIIQGYDYPRDRIFVKGDPQLFRPLLFILMGAEYLVFGTEPLGWQMTGIILHILCTVIIFRFLWLKFDRSLAFIFALYFAVLPSNMEMVVWQHINLYMLFLIFFYLVCFALSDFQKRHDLKSVLLVTAALTGAVFTYDLGCFVALIIAGYVFWITPSKNYRRYLNAGIVLMPVVVFSAWDFWSLSIHHLNRGDLAIPFSFVLTMKNYFLVHLRFLEWITFPSQFQIVVSHGRFSSSAFNKFNPLTICWIVLIYYFARALSMDVIRKGFESRGVFLVSLMIFVLILTVGRANPRGINYLDFEVYYAYMYMAFCLPLIVGLVDTVKLKNLIRNNRQEYLLFFAVIGSIGYCFSYTLNKNIEERRDVAPQRELLTFVNQFVEQHRNEPKFSFTVSYDAKGNYFKDGVIDPVDNVNYTFAQTVYGPFYKNYNWRYRIFYDANENMYRVQRKNWLP